MPNFSKKNLKLDLFVEFFGSESHDITDIFTFPLVRLAISSDYLVVSVGRVGGQSFLYFGLHSDYVSEHY